MGEFGVTTDAVLAAFVEEVQDLGGRVSECLHDGERLFGRSIFDRVLDVGPQDGVQGGVAIRCGDFGVKVQPYTFRLVCRNGAIFACAHEARDIAVPEFPDPDEVLGSVREAIRECASVRAFDTCAAAMAESRHVRAEPALWLMYMVRVARLSKSESGQVLTRFDQGKDPSWFGMMNALTSFARDTDNPRRRAELEELGGSVVLGPRVPTRRPPAAAEATLARAR